MKKILFAFIVFMFSAALGLMWRLGALKSVAVEAVELNEQKLIFLNHIGAYHKMNDTIVKVEKELARRGFTCQQSFGHYIDSPEHQDEDRLRSEGGCLAPSTDISLKDTELKTGVISAGRYVRAQFDGSPSISPLKVYPKVKEFAIEQRLRLANDFYEIYEVRGQQVTTVYLFRVL